MRHNEHGNVLSARLLCKSTGQTSSEEIIYFRNLCCTGRLYQVEYAMEAIGHAGSCLGILASDGVLIAAEKRNTNKLLDEVSCSEKIYKLQEYADCVLISIKVNHKSK